MIYIAVKLHIDQHVLGSRVLFLLEVVFFAEFICSDTILADLPEWSTLGKPRMENICNLQFHMKGTESP